MRIAKQQLKRIIREEYDDAVSEDPYATHWPAEDPEESKHRLTGPELRAFLRYLGVDPDNLPESDPLTPEEVADIQAAAEEAIAARSGGQDISEGKHKMNLTKQQLKQIVEEELATLTDGAIIWHDDSEKKKKEEEELRAFKRARRARLDKWDREREHDGYGGLTSRKSYTEGTLTKEQLEEIVSEELSSVMSEVGLEHDPFSPEGQRAARRSPTEVTGPAQIIQVKNGESFPLANVEAGETVMVRFEDE